MSLLTSLFAHWKLDEVSGTRNDSHGSNHLTDNNTVTSNPGKLGTAGQFTAANSEFLSINDNNDLSTGDIDFTMSCWVYLDSDGSGREIAGRWTPSGNQREYILAFATSPRRFTFTVSPDGASSVGISSTTVTPTTGTWYFVIVWHDSVANTLNIQVNNNTPDSVSHTTGVKDSTSPFNMGIRGTGGAYWAGRIDSFSFWKRTLTTQERTDLYNSGTGFDYPFSSGSIGSASGSGNANAIGKSRASSSAASSGVSTASGQGRSQYRATAAATGTGAAAATGKAAIRSAAATQGQATAAAGGKSSARSAASSQGTAAVLAVSSDSDDIIASAQGSATAAAVGASRNRAAGSASGSCVPASTGATRARATASAAGLSSVAAPGVSTRRGATASTGTATVAAVGRYGVRANSQGSSTASATGRGAIRGAGAAAGSSTVSAVGSAKKYGVGSATGISVVTGFSLIAAGFVPSEERTISLKAQDRRIVISAGNRRIAA